MINITPCLHARQFLLFLHTGMSGFCSSPIPNLNSKLPAIIRTIETAEHQTLCSKSLKLKIFPTSVAKHWKSI